MSCYEDRFVKIGDVFEEVGDPPVFLQFWRR